jgi:hypothetical protein
VLSGDERRVAGLGLVWFLTGCTLTGYTVPPPSEAVLVGKQEWFRYSGVAPQLVSERHWFGVVRKTVWRGVAPFTSLVVCPTGLPTQQPKRCLQIYHGIKLDGTKTWEARRAEAPAPWQYGVCGASDCAGHRLQPNGWQLNDLGVLDCVSDGLASGRPFGC